MLRAEQIPNKLLNSPLAEQLQREADAEEATARAAAAEALKKITDLRQRESAEYAARRPQLAAEIEIARRALDGAGQRARDFEEAHALRLNDLAEQERHLRERLRGGG